MNHRLNANSQHLVMLILYVILNAAELGAVYLVGGPTSQVGKYIVMTAFIPIGIIILLPAISQLKTFKPIESFRKHNDIIFKCIFIYAIGVIAISLIMKYFFPNLVVNTMSGDLITKLPLLALSAFLMAPVLEEVIFRRIIFGDLARVMDWRVAVIISSLLFAGVHFSISASPQVLLLGLITCYTYHKSKSIFPGFVIHSLNNLGPLVKAIIALFSNH